MNKAKDNNIEIPVYTKKAEIIRILEDRNLITPAPITSIGKSNLGVMLSHVPKELLRAVKRKARNAREALVNYKNYFELLKKEFITSSRLKKFVKTLEKKEKDYQEERDRIFQYEETASALKDFAKTYTINGSDVYDGRTFLSEARDCITGLLRKYKETKVKLVFKCYMERDVLGYGSVIKPFRFHSYNELNLQSTDEDELYDKMVDMIEEEIQKVEDAEGTGWKLHSIINLELHTVKYQPLRGSSYFDLPKFLKNKGAMVNIKTKIINVLCGVFLGD